MEVVVLVVYIDIKVNNAPVESLGPRIFRRGPGNLLGYLLDAFRFPDLASLFSKWQIGAGTDALLRLWLAA